VGEQTQAPRLELQRDATARIQLGDDSVQPQLLLEPGQAIDHAGRGAEGDLPGEDVVVGEISHALGERAAAVGGPAPARPTTARASSVWRPKKCVRLSRGSSIAPCSVVET